MLLHKAGKTIDEKNLTEVLKSAGVNADPVRVKALVASLSEVDIDEAIKSSPTMMPMAAAPTAAPTEAATPKAKPAEEKKEKEEEKEKEEAALEGLGALFG